MKGTVSYEFQKDQTPELSCFFLADELPEIVCSNCSSICTRGRPLVGHMRVVLLH